MFVVLIVLFKSFSSVASRSPLQDAQDARGLPPRRAARRLVARERQQRVVFNRQQFGAVLMCLRVFLFASRVFQCFWSCA